MSDVPDEILREILSRLPVAPLLRFRCVSKSWKGLIENQQFIKHHLNRTRNTNSNLNIVLCTRRNLYSVDLDLLNETNIATFKELSHPLKTLIPFDGTEIVGSCDGLLVLRNGRYDTILWNPSVRRFYAIPCSIPVSIEFPGIDFRDIISEFYYGFGYDVVSDDYKLIEIVQFHGKDYKFKNSVFKVYSLKSDSWRSFPDFPCIQNNVGVLANGAFHWIVNLKETRGFPDYYVADYWVAAFDLGTEEYRLVPLPKFAVGDRIIMEWSMLSVLEGCLSLNCMVNSQVYLWVMKEYGVQGSWSVLFTFYSPDFEFDCVGLKSYSKCGKKVLVESLFDLMWYDLDEKSFSSPLVQMPEDELLYMCTCSRSLVLLNNGTCDFDLLTRESERVIPANIGCPNGQWT